MYCMLDQETQNTIEVKGHIFFVLMMEITNCAPDVLQSTTDLNLPQNGRRRQRRPHQERISCRSFLFVAAAAAFLHAISVESETNAPVSNKKNPTAPTTTTTRQRFRLPGAGGSGPYEPVKDWIAAFEAKYPEADLTISSVGSGAAQSALWGDINCAKKPVEALCNFADGDGATAARVVDESEEATAAAPPKTIWGIGGGTFDDEAYIEHGWRDLQQLPALGGPILVTYSKDVTGNMGSKTDAQLNMTFGVVSGIFNGTVTHWDDPAIAAANPNLEAGFPSERIAILVRSDKSGMSQTFTQAISHATPEWPDEAVGKKPKWPLANITQSSSSTTGPATCAEASNANVTLPRHYKADGQTGIGLGLLRRPFSAGYLELGYFGGLTQFVSQAHVSSPAHPESFVPANVDTLRITMDGLAERLDPATLSSTLVAEDTPLGGYPVSRYVYWYIKKSYTEYESCYHAWLVYKFIEWSYTDPLAEEIALGHGWVVPPESVVERALAKLNEMQCRLDASDMDDGFTDDVISVSSYTPAPYRDPESAAAAENPYLTLIPAVLVPLVVVVAAAAVYLSLHWRRKQADSFWSVAASELHFDDPPDIIGRGTFGLVLLAEYRGTQVAVKRVIPPKATRKTERQSQAHRQRNYLFGKGDRSGVESGETSIASTVMSMSDHIRRSTVVLADRTSKPDNVTANSFEDCNTNNCNPSDAIQMKEDKLSEEGATAGRHRGPLTLLVEYFAGVMHSWKKKPVDETTFKAQPDSMTFQTMKSTNSIPSGSSFGSGAHEGTAQAKERPQPKASDVNGVDSLEKGKILDSQCFSEDGGMKSGSFDPTQISGTWGKDTKGKNSGGRRMRSRSICASKHPTSDGDLSGHVSHDSYLDSGASGASSVHRWRKRFPCCKRDDEYSRLKADFIVEMRHLSRLRHPCITTVMGAVISKRDEPMLVMEYMDHGSLYDLLHNDTLWIDGELVFPILRDIAQGVRFLHTAEPKVIHGDLKAANVLVDGNFRAKVADFGLSQKKKVGATGTPYWMAPELLRGESENTPASDVYSFGIILYEMYSRKDPYEGENYKEVIKLIADPAVNRRPPIPSACPPMMSTLMAECLVGQPAKRPSFEELDVRLKRLDIDNVEPGKIKFSYQKKNSEIARRTSDLIQDLFPRHVAAALQEGRKVEPESFEMVTIFFSDIVGFTNISSTLSAEKVCDMLDRLYLQFDEIADKHDVFKIETIGDAYLCVSNMVKDQNEDHVKRMAAFSIDAVRAANETLVDPEDPSMGYVNIRVGFHSGPVVANVLGTRNPKYSIFGDTVNTASRMESNSKENRIQCSLVSANLLAQQDPLIPLHQRGMISVKGKGEMCVYWVNQKERVSTDSTRRIVDISEALEQKSPNELGEKHGHTPHHVPKLDVLLEKVHSEAFTLNKIGGESSMETNDSSLQEEEDESII